MDATPLRICGWHEGGQRVLPIFTVTHSICPVCLARSMGTLLHMVDDDKKEDFIKRHRVQWPRLLDEGGWRQVCVGSYFPLYVRTLPAIGKGRVRGQAIFHCPDPITWGLEHDGVVIFYGDLDECLEHADNPFRD